MSTIFALLRTSPGEDKPVYDSIMGIPEVVEAHRTAGPYSIYAKLKFSDGNDSGPVLERIKSIKGVIGTSYNCSLLNV